MEAVSRDRASLRLEAVLEGRRSRDVLKAAIDHKLRAHLGRRNGIYQASFGDLGVIFAVADDRHGLRRRGDTVVAPDQRIER